MTGRRTPYEIYWEILVYCRSPRSFTAVVNRCDLNSRTGQEYIEFLCSQGYLSGAKDSGRTLYLATERSVEYVALFTEMYRNLFDSVPEFKL